MAGEGMGSSVWRLWKPDATSRLRRYLLSDVFQAAAQLSAGTLLIGLFSFVTRMRFTNACLSATFFTAGMLLLSKDSHVGSRLSGAATVMGAMFFGALLAGAVVSLAHAPGTAYTTFLCIFTCLALLIMVSLRVKGSQGVGIMSNLGFGIMLLSGQFAWPGKVLWQEVFTRVLKLGLIAGFGVVGAGVFILPTLAGDDLQDTVAHITKTLGNNISNTASCLLLRNEQAHFGGKDGKFAEDAEGDAALQKLEEGLQHSGQPADVKEAQAVCQEKIRLATLRPQLARCRELYASASAEAPLLRLSCSDNSAWVAVLDALDALVMRASALESLLAGREGAPLRTALQDYLGHNALPAFCIMFSQVAAACASASAAISGDRRQAVKKQSLFRSSWALLEYEVAGALHAALKAHWGNLKATAPEDFVQPPIQLRELLYMSTIGSAIMEAVADFEAALAQALQLLPAEPSSNAKLREPICLAIACIEDEKDGARLKVEAKRQDVELTALQDEVLHAAKEEQMPIREGAARASFRRSFKARPMQQLSINKLSANNADAASAYEATKSRGPPEMALHCAKQNLGWLKVLLKLLLPYEIFFILKEACTKDIPTVFGNPRKTLSHLCNDRWAQFAIKYFSATASVFSILLALQAHYPAVRTWNGLYIIITVVVVLSPKVDTTFAKGVIRVATTIFGATLGYLLLLSADVASNPYALTALLCTFAFIAGHLSQGPLKFATYMSIITFYAVLMCQYSPGKHHSGSVHTFYSRLVVTVMGVLICLAFDLLFPWYAAHDALDIVGKGFLACSEIAGHYFECWNTEVEKAALSEAACASSPGGCPQLKRGLLNSRIAKPMGALQASLAREGVLWKRGMMSLPPVVMNMMRLLDGMLEDLASMEIMLLQRPIVSGRYSGATWHYLQRHLQSDMARVFESLHMLARSMGAVLSESASSSDLVSLQKALSGLRESRSQLLTRYHSQLAEYALINSSGTGPFLAERTVDDAMRYQSMLFSMNKTLDSMEAAAQAVAEDPWLCERARHPHHWTTLHIWLGR